MNSDKNYLVLSNKAYGIAKKLVLVILPGISSLYFGLGNIWGFPAVEEVVGSIAVLTTTLGLILGVSTKGYESSGAAYDGDAVITEAGESKTISLELNVDPHEIENMDSVKFRVKKVEGSVPVQVNSPTP